MDPLELVALKVRALPWTFGRYTRRRQFIVNPTRPAVVPSGLGWPEEKR